MICWTTPPIRNNVPKARVDNHEPTHVCDAGRGRLGRRLEQFLRRAAADAPAPPKRAAKGRTLRRTAKATLTPCVLNHGDTLQYKLPDGQTWELAALATSYELIKEDRPFKCKNAYAFACEARINGRAVTLRREIGTQESFAEPYKQDGVNVWLDAVGCIAKERGGFLEEKDWRGGSVCMPSHHVRLVVHPTDRPICPEPLAMWYPNEAGRINIRDCYNGEDVFLGPYEGDKAHSGLDINMKAGTVLSAPLDFDNHYLFNSTAAGFNNNRWRGIKRWPDGSEWWLQSHHLIKMLVPEREPLGAARPTPPRPASTSAATNTRTSSSASSKKAATTCSTPGCCFGKCSGRESRSGLPSRTGQVKIAGGAKSVSAKRTYFECPRGSRTARPTLLCVAATHHDR